MRLETDRVCQGEHGCGAPMAWFKSEASRAPMPLDPDPVPDGNIVIRNGLAVVVGNDLMAPTANEGEPRYKSHFATCPNAKKFRKKK
jgi:hypothetical protein